MSKSLTIAQSMADRLNAVAALASVRAVVWKKKDLESELATITGKSTSALIVILYTGFENPDTSASVHLTLKRRYTLSIFAKPATRLAASAAADDIAEIVARTLHNWEPDETTTDTAEIRVASCDLRPDNEYLIYDMEIECLSRL